MVSINQTSSWNRKRLARNVASLIAFTVASLGTASGPLVAAGPTFEWPTIKWRAMPEPNYQRSTVDYGCFSRFSEPVNLSFDGKTLKSTGWTGMTYDMILQEPLNADGSGIVHAISMPRGRTMILEFEKFDPKRGPPVITFYGLYTAIKGGARCVWSFRPLVDVH